MQAYLHLDRPNFVPHIPLPRQVSSAVMSLSCLCHDGSGICLVAGLETGTIEILDCRDREGRAALGGAGAAKKEESKEPTKDEKTQGGEGEEKEEEEGEEEYVPSQALCVSVCSSGDSDRAFDYILPGEEWTHLAFVARRSPRGGQSEVSLVVNGEMIGTVLIKLGLPIQRVGSSDGGEAFAGQLAGFRYWGYDRSAAEIARDMRLEVPRGSDGLLGAWSLMEGRGSFVADMTSTFRACTQRRCRWEIRDDVPRLQPSLAIAAGDGGEAIVAAKETLLYPSNHGGALRIVEMAGGFERDAVKGVQIPWVRPYREPVIVRFALPDDDEEADVSSSGKGEKMIQGVVDWPERRVKAFASGKLVLVSSSQQQQIELEVGDLIEGCPQAHGWLKGCRFQGTLSDGGRELSGSWQVKTRLVRRPALGVGGMRLDPTVAPPSSDVIISDDGIIASRPDMRGLGYSVSGSGIGVLTVEICQVGPLPPGPSDPTGLGTLDLTGEALNIIEELVDTVVDQVIDQASQPTTALIATGADAAGDLPELDDEGLTTGGGGQDQVNRTFGYTHGKWFWEWLVVCNSSGNIGVGICTSKANLQLPIGHDQEGWAYYSTSEMLHGGEGGEGPHGRGTSESFGNGDVIGIELDLAEGSIRFIKNDR